MIEALASIHWHILIPLAIWLLPIPPITDGALQVILEHPDAKTKMSVRESKILALIVGVLWPIFFLYALILSLRHREK